ncbi:MAG: helix-turn-helix domain-containing protein [Nitrospinae bacterium]|nr:helix-turn-helix domain-containing protein [Nitrospinota bacterium]
MNFETVLARIKEVKALRHDSEVAALLGLGKTAFAERKRRNSLPVDKLAVFCEKESINMNWILSGRGRKEKCGQDNNNMRGLLSTKNQERLVAQIKRIFKEGDIGKIAVLQYFLDLMAPAGKKPRKDSPAKTAPKTAEKRDPD